MRALAQRQEPTGWRAQLVQRAGQAQQRLAYIDHGRAQRAQLHRCRQAEAVATAITDHAQPRLAVGQDRLQQRQAGITEGRGIGVGIGQSGRQHVHLLHPGPAFTQGLRGTGGVAGLQRLLHAVTLEMLLQLLQLAGCGLLNALHRLVAYLRQRVPAGLLPPLLHRAPAEPAGQQQQRCTEQRRIAPQ